jgi:ArsR family transcriptional regulator
MKKRVLFICVGNSARSQMAEALLRSMAGDRFEVYSAGTDPQPIDDRALEALASMDISTAGLRSKGLDEVAGVDFDFVIALCDKAARECYQVKASEELIAWDFEDPKTRDGFKPFASTLREIQERVKMFALVQSKS